MNQELRPTTTNSPETTKSTLRGCCCCCCCCWGDGRSLCEGARESSSKTLGRPPQGRADVGGLRGARWYIGRRGTSRPKQRADNQVHVHNFLESSAVARVVRCRLHVHH